MKPTIWENIIVYFFLSLQATLRAWFCEHGWFQNQWASGCKGRELCFTASKIGRMNDPIWSAKWVVETTNTSVSFSNLYTLNLVFKSLLSGVTNMSPLKVARTISWFCFSRGGHSLFGHDFQNVYHQRLIITDTLNQSAQVADACLNVFTCWGVGESLLKLSKQGVCVCVRSVLGRSPKKTSQTAFCFPCHHLWWFLSTCWNMLDKTPKG